MPRSPTRRCRRSRSRCRWSRISAPTRMSSSRSMRRRSTSARCARLRATRRRSCSPTVPSSPHASIRRPPRGSAGRLRLAVDPARFHFFDPATGLRLERAACSCSRSRLARRRAHRSAAIVVSALAGPPKASFLAKVRAGELGGVILVGRWTPREMAATTQQLHAAGCAIGRPLLLLVDQEGGFARRLTWAAPAQTARELGRLGLARTRAEAPRDRGCAARRGHRRRPRAGRGHAPPRRLPRQPLVRLRRVEASGASRRRSSAPCRPGGIAATAKHFPGLGAARLNTDDHAVSLAGDRARPVPPRDRRRREARDGLERVVSRARQHGRARGVLAADRHRPAARHVRLHRRRRDRRARRADARAHAACAGARARCGRRPAALHERLAPRTRGYVSSPATRRRARPCARTSRARSRASAR